MKPNEHILNLINAISQPEAIKLGRDRQVISLMQHAEPMCVILHEGIVSLYRGQDHLLMSMVKAPFIFGTNLLIAENTDVYLKARTELRFEILTQRHFHEKVKEDNLWESLTWFFMFCTKGVLDHQFISTGLPTYQIICNVLRSLMEETESLRSQINACDYIIERSLLSRSGVMKVLSDLRKGGHIEMERGVLIKINKLPSKY